MEVFSEASALVFSRRESQALRFPLAEPLTPPCNSEHPPAQQENSLQFYLGETAKTATTRLGWAGLGKGEYSVSYGFTPVQEGHAGSPNGSFSYTQQLCLPLPATGNNPTFLQQCPC